MEKNWNDFADAFAFLGNTLLLPMNRTATVGLSPDFWAAFPVFESQAVADAADQLVIWAEAMAEKPEDEAVRDVSVEYTRLFIGPPSPKAPIWETMNGANETTVGFGEPTFQMKQLLREVGLEVSNENNQYEDHMGIELLYASELARRIAQAQEGDDQAQAAAAALVAEAEGDSVADAEVEVAVGEAAAIAVAPVTAEQLRAFLAEHPLKWIDKLSQKVEAAAPDGYYLRILALAKAVAQAA